MEDQEYISIKTYCSHHQLDIAFVNSLIEFELIEVSREKENIPLTELPKLEHWIHLHYDLDINLEGIQAIRHLLSRIEALQQENLQLQNKIDFYALPPR